MNNNTSVEMFYLVLGVIIAMVTDYNIDRDSKVYVNWYLKGVEYCKPHDGLKSLDDGEFTCNNGLVIGSVKFEEITE